jgi:RNA polymerase sigma-70 factor (ECF subfamily)
VGDYLKVLVMKSDDDTLLARQAQQGDREAFLTLYNRYLNKVYNRVRSRVPAEDVEDVVQEIFIAAVRSLKNFEQRSQFNTWLYTIVNRQIADFYRKRGRTIDGNQLISLDSIEQTVTAPENDRDHMDERTLIQKALNAIPEHYREVIFLRFAEQLAFAEIAEQRGQSVEAVKSLYRRAIQAIREQIGDVRHG